MRRGEKEITDTAELEEILKGGTVCRIAMIDGQVPYLVPMNYGYTDGSIYMHCAREGRKVDILRAKNQVCFEIEKDVELVYSDRACSLTTHFKSIIGYGRITEIEDPSDKRRGLMILMNQYSDKPDWEFPDEALAKILVLRLDIESMTGKRSG